MQMANSIAEELYSEILKQSNGELGPKSTSDTRHCESHGMNSNLMYFNSVNNSYHMLRMTYTLMAHRVVF